MKARTSHITLVSLVCLVLLATFSASGAQAPTSPMPPEPQMAPRRPGALEPPPPGTGFIPPPMDLSHLTGQRMPSGGVRPQTLPSSWDWHQQGKVTPVKDQSTCGSCYAFAALGNIEAKMLISDTVTYDFSENNAKECNWREVNDFQYPNPGDYWGSCDGGNYHMLASLFSQKGTVLNTCDPYEASDVSCNSSCSYQKTLLDWRIISDGVPDTEVLKQYIYDNGPVYTAMYANSSEGFDSSYDGSYTFNYATPGDSTNHAVLIVGWSNNLPPVPGGTGPADGWIVKNSWGTGWGDNGYFYITYSAANIGTSSSFVHDWQDYDTNGDIWYYDDDTWWDNWGFNDTTVWGLAKFTASSNTNVTRVEFWTTDVTTDIDVYIYDSFDGTTLGTLLASRENSSFSEAGYHSVELSSPLAVTSGNDVVAVVKFTNYSYGYPLATDPHGTIETGHTYMSHGGSSWSDMGVNENTDVAIRLRTSTDVTEKPNVSITKDVVGSNFAPGDPIVFTLAIANNGNEVASQVVVTDVVPTEVLAPTFASTLVITRTGVLTYVWNVEPLGIRQGGVITIYGQIDPGLGSNFSFANTATISDPEDNTPDNNSNSATVGERKVYLPLVVKGYPPPPPGTFSSAGDACVMEGRATTNLGSASDMWAGYDEDLSPDGKIVRSLIQFDVSAIPSGTSIDSAVLRASLVASWDYPSKTRTITAYRIGSSWSESSVTWNTRPSCAEAYGSDSVTHGSWGWYSFDVTDLVSGWVNGSLSNYGVMLRGPEVSGSDSSWRAFSTREGSYPPQLAVTYSGYTTPAGVLLAGESLIREEPVRVVIEALTGRPSADYPGVGLCQPYSPAGEKCLALP